MLDKYGTQTIAELTLNLIEEDARFAGRDFDQLRRSVHRAVTRMHEDMDGIMIYRETETATGTLIIEPDWLNSQTEENHARRQRARDAKNAALYLPGR